MRYLSLIILLLLNSCENMPLPQSKDEAKKQAEVLSKKAGEISSDVYQSSEEIAELVSSKIKETIDKPEETLPAKELNKLREFEYKIEEFSSNISNAELENKLNKLGKDHWDCRHLNGKESEEKLKFLCKKRPFTPLRFVPKVV